MNTDDTASDQNAPPPHTRCKAELAERIERQLGRELDFWFPASLDDRGFRLIGAAMGVEPTKTIVYQSRLTWSAAAVAIARPQTAARFVPVVRHGLAFLNETMWDARRGGFYWQVDRQRGGPWAGVPGKHLYGQVFGLYAAAAAAAATGEPPAVDLADRAFDWLERYAVDAAGAGYFELFTDDGMAVLAGGRDVIGTTAGRRSMNATIHALEAVAAYHHVRPTPAAGRRLAALLTLVREGLVADDGTMALEFEPDGRPVPGLTSWGHNVETAFLLIEADTVLGRTPTARTLARARLLVDAALRHAWDDSDGGFFEKGDTHRPASGVPKEWWSAAEGLNALVMMDRHFGTATDVYRRRAVEMWDFIERNLLVGDGAWWFHVNPHRPPGTKWRPSVWQACYHTVRAQLHVLTVLRG